MPTSQFRQIGEIVQLIVDTDPSSLLDIGAGFGKYGFLAREYLELWDGRERYGDWRRRIDCIEAFPGYLTPVHRYVYDKVFIGDAIDILPTLEERYDLLLLVDVLEHFTHERGRALLQTCLERGRNLVVSVPTTIGSQGASFGNAYETHRSQWRRRDFRNFPDRMFLPVTGGSLIVYLGEDSARIGKRWRLARLRRRS